MLAALLVRSCSDSPYTYGLEAPIEGVYEIVCVNGLLILGESPLKHDGKSIECSLPISDGHGPLFGDIL